MSPLAQQSKKVSVMPIGVAHHRGDGEELPVGLGRGWIVLLLLLTMMMMTMMIARPVIRADTDGHDAAPAWRRNVSSGHLRLRWEDERSGAYADAYAADTEKEGKNAEGVGGAPPAQGRAPLARHLPLPPSLANTVVVFGAHLADLEGGTDPWTCRLAVD